jgi:hypothetical protein
MFFQILKTFPAAFLDELIDHGAPRTPERSHYALDLVKHLVGRPHLQFVIAKNNEDLRPGPHVIGNAPFLGKGYSALLVDRTGDRFIAVYGYR